MDFFLMHPGWISLGFLAILVALTDIGWRFRHRSSAPVASNESTGAGAVDTAVYALLGLLIAFTFSGAANRFDTRRAQIIQEANAIGTAYLRLDLLPPEPRAQLQQTFRQYVDSRLQVFRNLPDRDAYFAELDRANAMQAEIWKNTVAACAGAPLPAQMLVLPAINEMIDMAGVRAAAVRTHTPLIIYITLIGLALLSCFLAGRAMREGRERDWMRIIGFAGVIALTVYLILDLEFPRLGRMRLEAADQAMVDLRKSMD